jgi:hypothetical protein
VAASWQIFHECFDFELVHDGLFLFLILSDIFISTPKRERADNDDGEGTQPPPPRLEEGGPKSKRVLPKKASVQLIDLINLINSALYIRTHQL